MKFFLFSMAVLSVLFTSCAKKFDGKIETRKGGVYLINTSPSEMFQFTVKTTTITSDTIFDYSTEVISLFPGAEKLLGNEVDTEFQVREPLGDLSAGNAPDTDEYGVPRKHPIPSPDDYFKKSVVKHKYEITGQLQKEPNRRISN